MSKSHDIKPNRVARLAILSSHRTTAPITYSVRSKPAPVSLAKVSAPSSVSLASDQLPTTEVTLDIPSVVLQSPPSELVPAVDSCSPPLSQDMLSNESYPLIPSSLNLPQSLWDPLLESQTSLVPLPPELETEVLERSYSSVYSFDSEQSNESFKRFDKYVTDSPKIFPHEQSPQTSSSSRIPVPTLSMPVVDLHSRHSLTRAPSLEQVHQGSRLSVIPKHLRSSEQNISFSGIQATLSTSVENMFVTDREQLENTQSEIQTDVQSALASKSTQQLSRHTQSMPLGNRRFSARGLKQTECTNSNVDSFSPHQSEGAIEEGRETQHDFIENLQPDHLSDSKEEIIIIAKPTEGSPTTVIPEEDIYATLPLLVQGMEIRLPDVRVHKTKRKLADTHPTEDRSIHQFCLTSNTNQIPQNIVSTDDLPQRLVGKRYHRRPKLLYPLWANSSPKYSINRAELRDILYPFYDPNFYTQSSLDYFQTNYWSILPRTKFSSVYNYSLDRAIKHQFSSLNDIPSAVSKQGIRIRRVATQPSISSSSTEDEFIFPTDSPSKLFDHIQLQKDYITQIKKEEKTASTRSPSLGNTYQASLDVSLTQRRYSHDVKPILSRRLSYDAQAKAMRHSFSTPFQLSDPSNRAMWRDSIMSPRIPQAYDDSVSEIVSSLPLVGIDEIPKFIATVDSIDLKLSENSSNETQTALLLCRKGILLRYVGRLFEAHECFSLAIDLEPCYGEPLWYRAIISYVNGLDKPALRDLLTLLYLNPRHAQAYKLRGLLYYGICLYKNAMQDLTAALSLNPNDTQALIMRSDIYEKNGDLPLAIEDLKKTTVLDKSNILVLFKTARYQFGKGMYQTAIDNISTILLREPRNTDALCLRGRSYSMLHAYPESLRDFSAAIHYNPVSFIAFYHRACIMRKARPWQAVRDYSTAIVLDANNANTDSILHRAIVYRNLKLYDEAFFDISTYIKLNPHLAIGHTLIGLMYHKHRKDFNRAVYHLTVSIGLDPINAKTYACRGDAFFILSDLRAALLDYSRASHLAPDDTNYHILRGKVLLHMDKLSLAKKHLYYSRKLRPGDWAVKGHTGHSSILQLVVVENFLGKHEEALQLLESSRSVPSYDSFVLLGKTQMKLKNYSDALDNFTIARRFLPSGIEPEVKNKKIANILFLQGLCAYSLGKNSRAIESLTESLSYHPQSYETYYYRGLASIKSPHNKKGILDLNKSLALNTRFFQAYLARAAYYFMEGRISKAILNCNEAIELESDSIRAYFYRGTLKYFMKSYPSAINDLTHTISLDTNCYLAYYNRAACYAYIGSYIEAIEDYTKAKSLLESCMSKMSADNIIEAKIIQNRGLIYFIQSDYFNALTDFRYVSMQLAEKNRLSKALAIPLNQAIAISLHKLGQVNQAVNYMNLMLELDITCIHGFIGRGNIYVDYMNKPGYQLSKNDFCRAIHLDPTCTIARINLAFLLQFEGKYAQAWRQLTNALESDPNNPHALEARAIICLQMQDTFAATLDIDRALRRKKSPKILNSAGIIYFYSRYPKLAMEFFIAATKLDSKYQLSYFNAGTLLLMNKLYIESEETFSKALSPDLPSDEQILINRGIARALLGRKQGSLADLNLAEESNPNFAHIFVNKAYHHMLSGKTQLASEGYQKALSIGSNNQPILEQVLETLK